MKKVLITISTIIIITAISFTVINGRGTDSCASCHQGIETVSDTHKFPCVDCHGGDSSAKNADEAHKGMTGGKNPSDVKVWNITCGKCHEHQVDMVQSTIMLTNTGIIKNTQTAWGEEVTSLYSTIPGEAHDSAGNALPLRDAGGLDTMAGELYRKSCAACHVAGATDYSYDFHRSSGCAACHFSYNVTGTYMGGDKTIHGMRSYSESHAMNALPDDDVCMRCHNRSGRIALSYRGLYDGNNSMVPTAQGEPGPQMINDIRNVRHMKPDIHFEKGMECIDCHTQSEIMGDGYSYENMYHQLEISCESCHGDGSNLPRTEAATREMNPAFTASKNYTAKIPNGTKMVLTDKNRIFSNVYETGGQYWLVTKRDGKVKQIKTVKNTPEHTVYGHKRMECVSCHSRVVIQCYGCHTTYDERVQHVNFLTGETEDGGFSEKEDLRTFYPFPLALNQRGRISPITPGCQTFFTQIDTDGNVLKEGFVFDFKGSKKLKFAPFSGHNTGKKAVGCSECHSNLFFMGYGDSLFSSATSTLTSATICDKCDEPLNALYSIENGVQSQTADIVRENSRILSAAEITAALKANRCIICHDSAANGYFNNGINYEKILSDSTHAPLLR